MEKKKLTLRDIIAVGLMAALVFVFTYLHIDIPTLYRASLPRPTAHHR